jgi:cobalamin biosynthesis Mg chelatase CobN
MLNNAKINMLKNSIAFNKDLNPSIARSKIVTTPQQIEQIKSTSTKDLQKQQAKQTIDDAMSDSTDTSAASGEGETSGESNGQTESKPSGTWKIVLGGAFALAIVGGIGYYALKE